MIITFGSINLDITFPLKHMPKPGETVLGKTFLMNPGGKGANQALAAARAGSQTAMVGMVGEDGFADEALALLKEENVILECLGLSDQPTGCASIWVDAGGENSIAVASGANQSVQAQQVNEDWLSPGNWLLLQMETPLNENWKLVRKAKEQGCSVILNAAPAGPVPQDILSLLDILVVNEIEARTIADSLNMEAMSLTRLPRAFAERFEKACVLTMGGAGCLYFGPEGGFSIPALPIAPIDTTAAGDCFTGYLGACLDQKMDIEQSLRYASVAAGLCCLRNGAQAAIPTQEEIAEKLASLPASKQLQLR